VNFVRFDFTAIIFTADSLIALPPARRNPEWIFATHDIVDCRRPRITPEALSPCLLVDQGD
jgi:hypothetical protein